MKSGSAPGVMHYMYRHKSTSLLQSLIIRWSFVIFILSSQIQGESAKAAKSSFSFAKARAQKENFRYKGVFGTISTIVKEEGPRGLYRGLNPGMQRQLCFCGVRIGLYDNIKEAYTELLGKWLAYS